MPADAPQSLLPAIVQLARDPSVDVTKLQALLDMQVRAEARQAEAEFNRAFSAMEPNLPRVRKNGDVEYKGQRAFRFAKWEDIDTAIRPLLREHGFSLRFDTTPRTGDGGGLIITGTLAHTAGHSVAASMPLPLDTSGGKNNLQGGGSTFSYGKRYTTTMLLNLVFEGEDDDGAAAGAQRISEADSDNLMSLIRETGADQVKFLDFMGADSLDRITVADYPRAVNALLAKRKKQGVAP